VAEQPTDTPSRTRWIVIIILWFVAACFASCILAVLFVNSLGSILLPGGGCREQIVSEIPSPDGKLKAVLYVRDCGATTRASTQITVLKITASGTGPASKRVLAGYEYPWDAPTHKIGAKWTSDRALNVYYAQDVELTHLNNQVGNVHVRFELRPSTPKPKE
jgi:hypothetical protein